MRQIIADSETTGVSHDKGDRVVEIGFIEVINRVKTGKTFHVYINPERDVPDEVVAIHGLTTKFLSDKPKFCEIADELIEFVKDSEFVAHNGRFDWNFINMELLKCAKPSLEELNVSLVDTLKMAREQFPGKKNSLDILADRLGVNRAHRVLHGALLDAEILAEVYLKMTQQQNGFFDDPSSINHSEDGVAISLSELDLVEPDLTEEEMQAHLEYLRSMKEQTGVCPLFSEPIEESA